MRSPQLQYIWEPEYLSLDYSTNRKERVTAFVNDPLAKTLTIDSRQNFIITAVACSGFITLLMCFILKDAWIDPRLKRR
ncbi:hypothetical protein [Chamaesiphon sp. VAR_48_metabat_403]|uniref:hypothetical protein n=1 Tax=Chamaesiphon sp. VAR_48_metabat_403 TaxID=2964700 RepID=UPI00286E43B4|nr:hypothetical protein [Chamaesiphon sp. VAR_48_metabat_403]